MLHSNQSPMDRAVLRGRLLELWERTGSRALGALAQNALPRPDAVLATEQDFSDWVSTCLMDCYKDTPSMFAHMKNAHDVHELLFDHSTMVTEFLGELPDEAKAAVARYNPYILPLYAGLRR